MKPVSNPLLETALSYERHGFSVIPIAPRSKIPLIPWKRLQSVRADEAQIRRWWARTPAANVGVVTGLVSGLMVFDLDPRNDRDGSTARWLESVLPAPTVRTGSGGKHWYMRGAFSTVHGLKPGLDVQGNGAFVLAPPSIHASGNAYLQLSQEVPTMPSALRELVKQAGKRDEGQGRHNKTNGQPSTDGLSLDDVLAILQGVKQTGKGWLACCPAHDDHSPSLSVGEGRDGRLLLRCWVGCSFVEVMRALRDRQARQLVTYAQSLRLS